MHLAKIVTETRIAPDAIPVHAVTQEDQCMPITHRETPAMDRHIRVRMWDRGTGRPLSKNVGGFLTKLQGELPYGPACPLGGIYPQEMKALIQKDIPSPCSLQPYVASWVPSEECRDRADVAHIPNGSVARPRKRIIMPRATAWVDLEGTVLSDISHTEKGKCRMISRIRGV